MVNWPNNPVDGQQHSENGQTWMWRDPPGVWSVVAVGNGGDIGTGMVLPENFGAPTDGVSPASQGIQNAIDAVADGAARGPVYFDRQFAIDKPINLKPGVRLLGDANFNRRAFPNQFNGNRLYPHANMLGQPIGERTMIKVGTFGELHNNPNGTMIEAINLDGRDINEEHMLNLVGCNVRDTSDVYFRRCYFGGFDRTLNTGFGLLVEGTGEGNCFGTICDNNIFSNSQHGVFYTGLGTTDMRHSNNLYVGCTRAMTLGWDDRDPDNVIQQGGAGTQCSNDHFTYTGMPEQGWFIRNGGQGGSLQCSNVYFDQHGNAYPVRLGNAKAKITTSHFLMAAAQNNTGLIRVATAGTQETLVAMCTVDLIGSELQSLVHFTAKDGLPTNAIITANTVYGASGNNAWKGHVMMKDGSIVPPTDNGATYIMGNVRYG